MGRTIAMAAALLAAACGGDGGGAGDGDGDGGTDGGGGTGALELSGNWDGAVPEGATFKTAVFACPFAMPPDHTDLEGTVDQATGDVHGLVEGIPAGEWCVMAYVDMDPGDGLAPVAGIDAVNATGAENGSGAIPIGIAAGETTVLDGLVFAVQ